MKKSISITILFILLFTLGPYLYSNYSFFYSNNYITLKYFEKNSEEFNKIIKGITSENKNIGYLDNKNCENINSCYYNFILIKNNLLIKHIVLYKSGDFISIDFFLKKEELGYIQSVTPKLGYHNYKLKEIKSSYLKFPISNKFFYFGDKNLNINKNWYATGDNGL